MAMMYKDFTTAYYDMLKKFLFDIDTQQVVYNERTKENTVVRFNESMTVSTKNGAPLLNLRFINLEACWAEAHWFIQGSSDVEELEKNGCNFYRKHYITDPTTGKRTVGKYVGWMLRHGPHGDQFEYAVKELKEEGNRRVVINLFDTNTESIMPSCITTIIINRVGKALHMNITYRSTDFLVGFPNDAVTMHALGTLIGVRIGAYVESIHFNFANLHIYGSQVNTARQLYDINTFMGEPHWPDIQAYHWDKTVLKEYSRLVPRLYIDPVE